MKKSFMFVMGVLLASVAAQASTPFKNLYVMAESYPSGAGEIYLTSKDEDKAYVKYETDYFNGEAELMVTVGENGSSDQYNHNVGFVFDASEELGMYEAVIYIRPYEGYEFVCLAKEISESGVYYPGICYQMHTGTTSQAEDAFKFSWNYNIGEETGNLININSAARAVDCTTDNGSQQTAFDMDNWSDEPDTHLYAIFRKIGDELPKFDTGSTDELLGDADDDGVVTLEDAKTIVDYRLGKKSVRFAACDVNQDGEVNVADALKVIVIVNSNE